MAWGAALRPHGAVLKFLPRGRALAREFGTIFDDIYAATAIFALNAGLCPSRLSCHGLLARSIMLLLRERSTYPGCSDFRRHLYQLCNTRHPFIA